MKTILIIIAIFITSCIQNQVTIPIVKPAKINLAKYNNIAVGEILDKRFERDVELENIIKSNLVNFSNMNLLDERYLQSIVWNSKYNPESKNDSILNSTVVISASILQNDFNSYSEFIKEFIDKDSVRHKEYKFITNYNLKISFNITDIKSGIIIYHNTFNEFKSDNTKYLDKKIPNVNPYYAFSNMQNRIVDRFFRDILPTKVNVKVVFKDYERIYSIGINYAKQGLLDKAREYFELQVKYQNENRKLSMAYYNLGLCNMYLYDFDNAYYCFEQAEKYMRHPDNYNMIVKCQQLETDFLELQKQIKE